MDDINEPTPCTLIYVKGRMLRTIEVANTIVMLRTIEVTTIRERHEFEDLDYPDEEEGIEKLKDAKGNFILWLRKDIILKTRSSPIVSPQSKEDECTSTSQNTIRSTARFTPPSQNPPQTTPPLQNLR
jgi:hypothetical protein